TLVQLPSTLAAAQTYSIEFQGGCGAAAPITAPLHTSPAAPLPTTVGAVELRKVGHGPVSMPHGGSCRLDGHAAFAQFRVAFSPELARYLPVTSWELELTAVAPTAPVE